MRRAGRKKKPLTIQPIKCVVMLASDEENDCIAAEKKENKQLKRIMEFADNNNLIPMKVFRRGIFGRRLRDEVFYKAIRYMRAGKADALIVTNLDAISDGIADSYLKIGAVREAGYRLFSVDEKEPKVDLYIPPKRGNMIVSAELKSGLRHIQAGRRPCIVISCDKANGKSPVYTVVPGTTKLKKDYIPVHFNIEPSEIRGFLRHTTMFLPEQLVTINEEQIIQTAGMIVSTDAKKKVEAMLVRQLQIGEYDG